jgi:REP element-mobilizing transposase RayT
MARPIRVEYEGAVYHVTARGNEQKTIYSDDTDRRVFLDTLAQACGQFGLVVQVYCLMPNHYHLVVQTPQANLSQALGWIQTTYSIRFNHRHHRSGHLFQGRFQAHLVEADAYARRLVVYIHLNPVRPPDKQQPIPAERRSLLDGFVWSSHQAYSGRGHPQEIPPWLSLEWLWYFGASRGIAQREYRRQIADCFGQCVPDPFAAVQGGFVLGSERLWEKVKACVAQSGGQEEIVWSRCASQAQRRRLVEQLLEEETDRRVQIWARVRLGGERLVDVAVRYGFRDGSGVHRVVQRLEVLGVDDVSIGRKLKELDALVRRTKQP